MVSNRTAASHCLQMAAVAVLYLFLGWTVGALRAKGTLPSPLWPPAGLAVAAILLMGYRVWPGILLGALGMELVVFGRLPAGPDPVWFAALGSALGSTAAALLGAWLTGRYAQGRRTFDHPISVLWFAGLAGFLSTTVCATLRVSAWVGAGYIPGNQWAVNWLTGWLGDVVGVLLFTPLLVVWIGSRWSTLTPARWIEAILLGSLLALVSTLAFGWLVPQLRQAPLAFLTVPFVAWAAVRFGQRGTTVVLVFLAGFATFSTLRGYGPFAEGELRQSLLLLQNYIAILCLIALCLAADVSQRRAAEAQLEERVRHRTAQLEAANKELEAFSYSVSHDLRAPLRSIRGFSEILLERYADRLDDRGQDYLRRTVQSSAQMDTLIEDLLKLSRVGRAEMQHRPLDLSALAQAVVEEVRQSDPQRDATFHIAPGLRAQGDERLIRIVLDNLLRNAWKFTSRKPKAVIELGQLQGPTPVFFVRDNGAGFDMAYAQKLFGVFQRLHSNSEFPGTGVGLATVQRIIHRHGGRVWAEAAPEKGATFYFTLPQHEPA